ncbi:hypothetical protein F4802DRAFT_28105 [Xylaria palmicola]|nr:hypothetical protein F4802DRAFT_28105 [Xylaria palmicola]
MPTNRPRRHSLSSGDESLHPHPAKAGGLARRESRRRARLPRSKSTSNVFESLRHGPGTPHQSTRSVALEQANTATLRELAEFLRTTGPPPERPATHDECLRLSGSGEPRRWSLQSFRRNKRTKLQRLSLQSHLPGNVVPGTTAGGHPYIAISTPVPKNEHVGGPWFRSQYPVFLPESQSSPPPCRSGPKVWPERSSSKAAIPSSSGKSAALGDIGSSPRSAARAIDKNLSPRPVASAEGRSRALANRVSTDHLLRAMLNPVDGIVEHDVGVCLKKLGSRKVPGMEQPQVQAQRLVAVYEEASHQSETPQQATITHTASPPRSSPDERRRESPSVSPAGRNPSRSLSNATRQLTNISIHGGLAVPKENVPPESPGFPNMLAAINFPSPPKSSRPSSPASPTPSVADVQVSTGSRPIIQRRTSSRRTYVSTSVSAASLDQVVMQKRPSTRCKNSDGPADVSITGMNTSESSSGSSPPTARAEYPNLLEDVAALDNINTG